MEYSIYKLKGAGGFLQTIISGYAGIRINTSDPDKLSINPICPEISTGMEVKGVSYLGSNFNVAYTCGDVENPSIPTTVSFLLTKTGKMSLSILWEQKMYQFLVGKLLSFDVTSSSNTQFFILSPNENNNSNDNDNKKAIKLVVVVISLILVIIAGIIIIYYYTFKKRQDYKQVSTIDESLLKENENYHEQDSRFTRI